MGFLFGIFIAGAFVAVNYGTINISGKLAISALIEWTMVGVLVGILYKPS